MRDSWTPSPRRAAAALAYVGHGRDGVDVSLGVRIVPLPAVVVDPFQPVLPDVTDSFDADPFLEEPDRPSTDHGHHADTRDERAQRINRLGKGNRVGGIVDDRCQRAVEVDEDRETGRFALEERCGGRVHRVVAFSRR
jgi:hypothetical protein